MYREVSGVKPVVCLALLEILISAKSPGNSDAGEPLASLAPRVKTAVLLWKVTPVTSLVEPT